MFNVGDQIVTTRGLYGVIINIVDDLADVRIGNKIVKLYLNQLNHRHESLTLSITGVINGVEHKVPLTVTKQSLVITPFKSFEDIVRGLVDPNITINDITIL